MQQASTVVQVENFHYIGDSASLLRLQQSVNSIKLTDKKPPWLYRPRVTTSLADQTSLEQQEHYLNQTPSLAALTAACALPIVHAVLASFICYRTLRAFALTLIGTLLARPSSSFVIVDIALQCCAVPYLLIAALTGLASLPGMSFLIGQNKQKTTIQTVITNAVLLFMSSELPNVTDLLGLSVTNSGGVSPYLRNFFLLALLRVVFLLAVWQEMKTWRISIRWWLRLLYTLSCVAYHNIFSTLTSKIRKNLSR
jgi:hypothetical protein